VPPSPKAIEDKMENKIGDKSPRPVEQLPWWPPLWLNKRAGQTDSSFFASGYAVTSRF